MRLYPTIFTTVFARMDAERAHHVGFTAIKLKTGLGFGGVARRFTRPAPELEVTALGMKFSSPFGLAAGFDKGATGVQSLGNLGFGHVEIGTVTALAQPGNPRPRLFRLIPDRAVINRMGFNNDGAAAVVPRLEAARMKKHRPVIGVNIGKSRVVEVQDAVADYVRSAQLLAPLADYLVVNVSSPNTPGLRGLQEINQLEPLLSAVQREAGSTPLLVKIAPDLSDAEIDAVADLVLKLGLDGIIATNTTLSREGLVSPISEVERAGEGGLSGQPLVSRALEVLQILRNRVPAELCIISVGGVTSAGDVLARMQAGATLVQGYTAFLYEGPLWARAINRGLAKLGFRGN
jgi:dihydroorotate dehydrogenase